MRRFGWSVDASLAVTIDDRAAAAPTLALAAAQTSAAAWLVVVSADRDPIVAVGLFLRAVLDAAGTGTEVLLLAAGADDERLAIWQRFMRLQRLPIGVEGLS